MPDTMIRFKQSADRLQADQLQADRLQIVSKAEFSQVLQGTGIGGWKLVWADPVCDGPTPKDLSGESYRSMRARFIAARYDEILAAVLGRLIDQDEALERADDYAEVILWAGSDLFDQSVLMRLLAWFAEHPHPSLSLVQAGGPLAHHPPDALMTLFETRRPVSLSELKLASDLWELWRGPDPRPLEIMARHLNDPASRPASVALPYLSLAIRRHLANLPGAYDGLSLTERLILRAVANGAVTAQAIFTAVSGQEAAAWLSKRMLLPVLQDLSRAPFNLLDQADGRYRLTPIGGAVVMGQVDALQFVRRCRWVGGCILEPRPEFRWHEQEGRVLAV